MECTIHTIRSNELFKRVVKTSYAEKIALQIVANNRTTSRTKSVYDFIDLAASAHAKNLLLKMLDTLRKNELLQDIIQVPISLELNGSSQLKLCTPAGTIWSCCISSPITNSNFDNKFTSEVLGNIDNLLNCHHENKRISWYNQRNQWAFQFEE